MESVEHEDSSFAHAWLGLAEDIDSEDALRDTLLLHLGWVLEAAVDDCFLQLGFQ
jgi:hypothetical protein